MSVARVQFTGPSYGAIIACIWPISAERSGMPPWPPRLPPRPPRPPAPPSALKICSKGVPLNGLSSGPPGLLLMAPNYPAAPNVGAGVRGRRTSRRVSPSRLPAPLPSYGCSTCARPRSTRPRCWPLWRIPAAGGVNLFVGAVRDHDGGESVDHLDYSAHPSALDRLREVADGRGRRSST